METVVNKMNKNGFGQRLKDLRDRAESFCTSNQFIFIVTFVAFIFHALALDFWGIALFAFASALFFTVFKDFRPGMTVMLSAIFIVSTKNSPGYGTGDNYYLDPKILYPLIGVVGVLLVAMLIRCIRNRKNFLTGKSYIPLLILAVALTLSGVGRKYYSQSLPFGLLMGLTYVGLYVLFVGVVEKVDGLLDYVSTLLSAFCLLIAVQVAFFYVMHVSNGGTFGPYWKDEIIIGWGVSNIVGEMIVFFMPFIVYKIERDKNHYLFYNFVAILSMAMLVLTLNRTGMLFGAPMFAFLWIRAILKNEDREKIILFTVIFVSLGIICLMSVLALTELSDVFDYFGVMVNLEDGIHLSSRDLIWKQAFQFFKDSPWIGEGFARSFNEPVMRLDATMFQTLSHNFIIQAIGSGGIIGTAVMVAFALYMASRFLRKYDGNVYFISFAILYACISLFDTTYFITYSVMFLMFILVAIEKLAPKKEKVKARVLTAKTE